MTVLHTSSYLMHKSVHRMLQRQSLSDYSPLWYRFGWGACAFCMLTCAELEDSKSLFILILRLSTTYVYHLSAYRDRTSSSVVVYVPLLHAQARRRSVFSVIVLGHAIGVNHVTACQTRKCATLRVERPPGPAAYHHLEQTSPDNAQ